MVYSVGAVRAENRSFCEPGRPQRAAPTQQVDVGAARIRITCDCRGGPLWPPGFASHTRRHRIVGAALRGRPSPHHPEPSEGQGDVRFGAYFVFQLNGLRALACNRGGLPNHPMFVF